MFKGVTSDSEWSIETLQAETYKVDLKLFGGLARGEDGTVDDWTSVPRSSSRGEASPPVGQVKNATSAAARTSLLD